MIITQRIYVEPKFLTRGIQKYIKKTLEDSLTKECTKDYGYILSVNEILSIKQLCTHGTINFLVDCDITTMKPHVGDVVSGPICLLTEKIIVVIIQGIMKVLISPSSIKDMKYMDSPSRFITQSGKTIAVNTEVSVKITQIKYHEKKFDCFGVLII